MLHEELVSLNAHGNLISGRQPRRAKTPFPLARKDDGVVRVIERDGESIRFTSVEGCRTRCWRRNGRPRRLEADESGRL